MDIRVPPFQTNAPVTGGGYKPALPIWSMQISDIDVGGNPKLATAVLCDFAGLTLGTNDYTITLLYKHAVDDLIFVFQPEGGTGQTHGSRTVTWMELPGPPIGTLFRVNLSSTSGSAGSKTSAPSWQYTVTDLNAASLGTGMSPEEGRSEFGARSAATRGMGYFSASGAFVLAVAWEIPGTTGCPA